MKPVSLGLSKIHGNQTQSSRWELLAKACIFAVICALLAMFFVYLTGEVQIGTAHATHSDDQSQSGSY